MNKQDKLITTNQTYIGQRFKTRPTQTPTFFTDKYITTQS